MDDAPGDETTTLNLTRRILAVNFAAIHTSSMVRLFIFRDSLIVSNQNRPSRMLFITWPNILSMLKRLGRRSRKSLIGKGGRMLPLPRW